MRTLIISLLSLLSVNAAGAVNFGDTLETVVAGKDEPTSKLERGNVTVLTYRDAVIRLEDGKVVSIKPPGADYATGAVAAKPMPKGSRSSASSPSGSSCGQWTTDYASALAAASGTDKKVFPFFAGSDS
ncbi:MAG: hypothetical protein IPL39_18135 [Opitutaceae bacterium]|nr:hypothetical protein [Opitutaceae bacterium]